MVKQHQWYWDRLSFATSNYGATDSSLNFPTEVAFDSSGNLWVADEGNNRVLEFAHPFKSGELASVVLGQSDFTSSASATAQNGLNDPYGVALDPAGNVWVADTGNNRVLEFLKGSGFTTGEDASLVLGQPDYTSSSPADITDRIGSAKWNNSRPFRSLGHRHLQQSRSRVFCRSGYGKRRRCLLRIRSTRIYH